MPVATEIPASKLANCSGIARLTGVSKSAVSQWQFRHDDFPEPVVMPHVAGHMPLWNIDDIAQWCRKTGRPFNLEE
jgi:phage terminase Nu1 subunit (DNA packaging protein)